MIDWVVNGLLLFVCFVIAFFLLKKRDENAAKKEREKALAAAAKDNEEVVEKPYTLKELREYDGSDENKPILVAVNYKVYDVTKRKDLYGKGGSYQALAGHDASRALATMDITVSDEWDDLANLGGDDWSALKDWEQQFMMKYRCFGWLEKEPGKDPAEDEQSFVKEVESVGPNKTEDTVDDLLEDDQPQTGDKADKSQPDETQPIEETAQVEESEEQSHDQIKGSQNEDQEPGNDQTEADDQDQQLQDQDQQHQDQDQQHQDQDSEAKEEESKEPVGENQEGDKNEVEASQGDQEQDENSAD